MANERTVHARWYNGLGPALEIVDITFSIHDTVTVRWSDEKEEHEKEVEYTNAEEPENERSYITFAGSQWFLDEAERVNGQ